jgi:hypothetical protein
MAPLSARVGMEKAPTAGSGGMIVAAIFGLDPGIGNSSYH